MIMTCCDGTGWTGDENTSPCMIHFFGELDPLEGYGESSEDDGTQWEGWGAGL